MKKRLIDYISDAKNVLIVIHVKPDGDCIGSGLSLRQIVEDLGKNVDIAVDSELPKHYEFVKNYDKINDIRFNNYDLVISSDCADELRLGKYYSKFKAAAVSVNIDHHPTNRGFGKVNILKPTYSSACEIVYGLIKDDFTITPDIATWLYMGLSTDTGNFMHNNTSPSTLTAAADLLNCGVDLPFLINKLYKNSTKQRLMLLGRAIDSIRFYEDSKISIITITKDMLLDCGCTLMETEGIIDYGINIEGVKVAVCMTQQAENSYKVSFRSKGPDVSASASVFGGGGHMLASGCVVNGRYHDVVDKIMKAIKDGDDL